MLGVTIHKRNDKSYVILRQRNEPFIIPNVPCCTEPKKKVCICSLPKEMSGFIMFVWVVNVEY